MACREGFAPQSSKRPAIDHADDFQRRDVKVLASALFMTASLLRWLQSASVMLGPIIWASGSSRTRPTLSYSVPASYFLGGQRDVHDSRQLHTLASNFSESARCR